MARRRTLEEAVRGLRAGAAELEALRTAAEERARREDFLSFQVREIDEAELAPDEEEELEAEHRRLVHAERLGGETQGVVGILTGDVGGADERSVGDRLAACSRGIEGLAKLDASLAPLAERLEGARAELADLAADLERYAAGIETDAGRLEVVEERIRRLESLRRKYGSRISDILAFRDEAAGELARLGGSDERMGKLAAEQAAEVERVAGLARHLTRERRKAAKALSEAAQAAVRELAMDGAQVEVQLQPVAPEPGLPCGSSGAETVEILFSANAGEAPRALRRVASGGELSRVFLALKNVLRADSIGMVLVFDEVDAGIGGAVAERVGGVLAALGGENQVLCITHLPQIAAQPGRHFRVRKTESGGRTRTAVEALEGQARIEEVARMAGGEALGDETRRHAEALLGGAKGGPTGRKARRKRS